MNDLIANLSNWARTCVLHWLGIDSRIVEGIEDLKSRLGANASITISHGQQLEGLRLAQVSLAERLTALETANKAPAVAAAPHTVAGGWAAQKAAAQRGSGMR